MYLRNEVIDSRKIFRVSLTISNYHDNKNNNKNTTTTTTTTTHKSSYNP